MCGLVGFSSNKNKSFNIDKIKFLLMLNQERGKDSYGFYTPESGIIKDTGKIEECLIKKNFNVPESNMFIGHTRSSSVGGITKANAHPFHYGNIILAMNGTLSNHWPLSRDYKLSFADFNVDSQVLTAMLNIDQNKSPLSKIIGGCAVIYTNTDTNKVYCYRNSDRPLFRGIIDECMYMSSTEQSLKIIGCNDVKEFKEDNLYEIFEGKVENTYKIKRATEKPAIFNSFNDSRNTTSSIYANFIDIKGEDLVGKWLTPKHTTYFANAGEFHVGYRYEVVGSTHNSYDIKVIDHKNKEVIVSKYTFEERFPIIKSGSYVFATSKISYTGKEHSLCASIGDLMYVTDTPIDKESIGIRNLTNNNLATIRLYMCRHAMPSEVDEYKQLYLIEAEDNLNLDGELNYELNVPEDKNSDIEEKIKQSLLPLIFEKEKELVKDPEEIFYDEIKEVKFDSFDDLAIYTVNAMEEIIDNLSECKQSDDGEKLISKLRAHINNYEAKSLKLLKINKYV